MISLSIFEDFPGDLYHYKSSLLGWQGGRGRLLHINTKEVNDINDSNSHNNFELNVRERVFLASNWTCPLGWEVHSVNSNYFVEVKEREIQSEKIIFILSPQIELSSAVTQLKQFHR
jgi:hypothetical protein